MRWWTVFAGAGVLTFAPTGAQLPAPSPEEDPSVVAATIAADAQVPSNVEVVLVTGEQPGPGLWKVSSGDHVMWILGTHGPLPRKMTWRSTEVDKAIAEAQEILTAGGFVPDVDVGWYKIPFLVPAMFRAARNPDGARLENVVPADIYADWLRLKAKYLGKDNGVEKWRPAFAWEKLYGEAFEASGLSYQDEIWPVVSKAARKYRVRITDPTVTEEIKVERPKAALKEFSSAKVDDVGCFSRSLQRLESNLEAMKHLANAWSIGDLDAYQAVSRPDLRGGCQELLFKAALDSRAGADIGIEEILVRGNVAAEEKWMSAAERALTNNKSTFALLPVDDMASADGRLAKLKAKGYWIEKPDTASRRD